jgi:copper chaperone NosL
VASAGSLRRARAALAALALALAACARGEGPSPIAWDREPCAHCRMLISEPRFAAQLETEDGEVRSFDDPGCLLAELVSRSPRVAALWFHHAHEDRWLAGAAVAFERAERTPMGWGLGAVDAGTPGAASLAQAQAQVAAKLEQRR